MYRPESAIARSVHYEFSQLADLLWKLPSFLDAQFEIEREKLDAYFSADDPDVASMRSLRSAIESQKLNVEFPRFLSQTGVLLSVALYEARLVQNVNFFCRQAKPVDGLSACWKLVPSYGINKEQLRFAQQVAVALRVRHCVIHLSGYLDRLRHRTELKSEIENKYYLEDWQREREVEGDRPWLGIETDNNGERLTISHEYSFGVCSRLRDNLCDLIDRLESQSRS